MTRLTRRKFLANSAAAGLGLSACTRPFARILGINSDVRVAVIGVRSKGAAHVEDFRKLPGVRVVAICDVDEAILDREMAKFEARNETVKPYRDVRQLLDDGGIDAVVIATPNHWHALMGVWACQAGKDVYVEKPISHSIWEGQQLVAAARRHRRIVQAGHQNRSDIGFNEAIEYIRAGNLGSIRWFHGMIYRRRKSIGKIQGPQPIPPGINYDLWTGPATAGPLMRKNLHYDWHWFWDTGNGEMGNNGVHSIDDCQHVAGSRELPRRIMSFGCRYHMDDDGETPNTHVAMVDAQPAPYVIEIRNLPSASDAAGMDHEQGVREGIIVHCEGGYFAGGRGGGWVYDNDGNKIVQFTGDGGATHGGNFIDAVKSRKSRELRGDLFGAHLTSAIVHMANISYRIGRETHLPAIKEQLKGHAHGLHFLERYEEHLYKNSISLADSPSICGPWLSLSEEEGRFTGEMASQADPFLRRPHYRPPFVFPKTA